MSEMVIGIDPDAQKYGIAVYFNGKLCELAKKNTVEFVNFIQSIRYQDLTFVIEDVATNKFIYARNNKLGPAQVNKIAQAVGMCKHAQAVAEQFIEANGFTLVRIPPTKGNWAKDRKQFEMVTGWTKNSNEDTRSAAFFGFLHLQGLKQKLNKLELFDGIN